MFETKASQGDVRKGTAKSQSEPCFGKKTKGLKHRRNVKMDDGIETRQCHFSSWKVRAWDCENALTRQTCRDHPGVESYSVCSLSSQGLGKTSVWNSLFVSSFSLERVLADFPDLWPSWKLAAWSQVLTSCPIIFGPACIMWHIIWLPPQLPRCVSS